MIRVGRGSKGGYKDYNQNNKVRRKFVNEIEARKRAPSREKRSFVLENIKCRLLRTSVCRY